MSALSYNFTIYASDDKWAAQTRTWLNWVETRGQCRISGWPSEMAPFVPQPEPGTEQLICFHGMDPGSHQVRTWPHTYLEKLSCIMILPRDQRSEWQACLAKYDWDVLDEEDYSCSLLNLAVHSRIRILGMSHELESLSRQADITGNWAVRQWVQEQEALEKGMGGRAEFLTNMSHEIRTPLNTIIGMSDMLMESHIHGVEKKHLDVIKKSSQALLILVENILDLARLESGCLLFEQTAFNIHELVEQCFEIISPRAHKKGLETVMELDANLPVYIATDRNRLNQILLNLLSNAARYTERGQISIYLGLKEKMLEVIIQDSGPGLTSTQLSRLWQSQPSNEPNLLKTQSGPGLGLVLARRFVEGLGGTIQVDTKPDQGTRFALHIPVETQTPAVYVADQIRNEVGHFAGRRALLLDDHQDSARVVGHYLEELGLQVDLCSSSAEFLNRLVQFREHYDVALIDYETAGPQLSSWLSQSGSLPRDLRIGILLKSNNQGRSRLPRRKSTLGIHHLLKPVKRFELASFIKIVFEELDPAAELSANIELLPKARADESFRILIVDDSKENRYLMQVYLRNAFHATWYAEDGSQAVKMTQAKQFDLIIMGLQMPEMDGITATQLIRAHEQQSSQRRTPIYALTAHNQLEERRRAVDAGCDDYIVKPVTKSTILAAISRAKNVNSPAPPPVQLEI